jgi:RNA polymerase sigma-70 factor (ECF subfamily)
MSSETEYKDRELMQKVTAKDSKALEVLYNRYSPILFTLIQKIVGKKSKAEEILADVFVIIWKKNDQFDFNSMSVYVWLISLARNKAIDAVKRDNGESMDEYTEEYENKFILPQISKEIEQLELSDAFDKRDKMYSAMHKLTEAQQYVLSLAYFDGLTEAEIAQKLNIPVPTIKTKIRIALNSVSDNLAMEEKQ